MSDFPVQKFLDDLNALAQDKKMKTDADKKAKKRQAEEDARRQEAEQKEAERKKKEAQRAAEDAKLRAAQQAVEEEKARKQQSAADAKAKADALEEKKRQLDNAQRLREEQRKSRDEDDWSDASSRSSQDVLERLLRTFVPTVQS